MSICEIDKINMNINNMNKIIIKNKNCLSGLVLRHEDVLKNLSQRREEEYIKNSPVVMATTGLFFMYQ